MNVFQPTSFFVKFLKSLSEEQLVQKTSILSGILIPYKPFSLSGNFK